MNNTLAGKIALITGAAGGIGASVAREFAKQGAHLALLDTNMQGLATLEESLRRQGTTVRTTVADLSTQTGVIEGMSAVLAPYGHHIDVLVCNVGQLINGPFLEVTEEQWEAAFAINFSTHRWAIRHTARLMISQQRGGAIVCIGSDQGLQVDASLTPYAAAKAALHCLVKALARELAPHGIWVSAIAPGMTRTPLVEKLMSDRMQEWHIDRQEQRTGNWPKGACHLHD